MNRNTITVFNDSRPAWVRYLWAIIPFLLVIVVYSYSSDIRLADNPNDKLLPSLTQMVEAVDRMAFTPDRRKGEYLMLQDTLASLQRLLLGVGLAAITALLLGLNMGVYRKVDDIMSPFMTTVSMIPPLAILPILFITFGIGEVGKVALIFIGTFPLFTRDIYLNVKRIPKEQFVKAMSLGASSAAITYKIVLPQILPRLIQSVRLGLGAAWLFLIASEAIASSDGLGYRIFLVRRYMSMDVILPYVAWITLLGFTMDLSLKQLSSYLFPWYEDSK
jgi:NitT/TauT family transport system permease protein